jgi:hypothetical protein
MEYISFGSKRGVESAATGSLAAALLLAAVYLLGHKLLPLERKHPRRWISLAAGASMAYVFLDLLPELGARHRAFLANVGEVSFAERRIYALALVGFVLMYALYSVIIGDSLVNRGEMGFPELWLYLTAMGFHLLVVTSALSREHGTLYHARGRWVLAAGILAGWAIAVLAPLSEVAMSRLFAFVAGGVIMTSANEELPREKGGRFGWFVIGAGMYAALLLLT